jgi:hypothetical protein
MCFCARFGWNVVLDGESESRIAFAFVNVENHRALFQSLTFASVSRLLLHSSPSLCPFHPAHTAMNTNTKEIQPILVP